MQVKRARIVYLLQRYPQISQTYIKNEIDAVCDDYEIEILCRRPADVGYARHHPFHCVGDVSATRERIKAFAPTVLHIHYLNQLELVGPLARQLGIPFTVRAHSFDSLALRRRGLVSSLGHVLTPEGRARLRKDHRLRRGVSWLNDEHCLGALVFPFARPLLEAAGVRPDKLVDCWPVIHHARFEDRSPNGLDVMNTGAALPKKQMSDFLRLARLAPGPTYRLYGLGYTIAELEAANAKSEHPIELVEPIEPEAMPAEYKRHRWLVYTASFGLGTVGWPMAVAEAQASGVGVCVPAIRSDIRDFVGDAGIVYRDIAELVDVVRQPVPAALREAGFEQSKRSDILRHKHLLTDLWDRSASY